jgi:hypothetical protein
MASKQTDTRSVVGDPIVKLQDLVDFVMSFEGEGWPGSATIRAKVNDATGGALQLSVTRDI